MRPTPDAAAAFAAFSEAVVNDASLILLLRPPREREAFVTLVVATGAERGFAFDAAAVRSAMRAGEETWLLQGSELA